MTQPNHRKLQVLRRTVTSPSINPSACCKVTNDEIKYPAERPKYTSRFSESDRFCEVSSDEEDYEDFDDDDGMCIRLDSDDDENLAGFHIDLKTLQAVSTMLAHYNPIIQSDIFGNPTFVPPPPPPDEEYYEEESKQNFRSPPCSSSSARKHSSRLASDYSYTSTLTGEDDYHFAIQELEDVLLNQDSPRLSDAMNELSDVMEKMTRFTEEMSLEDN